MVIKNRNPMRPLEILIPIILVIYILWPLTGRKRSPAVGVLPALALVVIVTHSRVEGLRWQMYPLYAITTVTFLMSLSDFSRDQKVDSVTRPRGWNLAGVILTLILLAVSTVIPALLPASR
jgi:uncharacterized membrane protein YjgN (DUF898 family)